MLKFAKERGYLGNKSVPNFKYKANRRLVCPVFTVLEYSKLCIRMRKWINETKNESWHYTRELLRDYVLILSNSGMRVGEANNLKESDVVEFKDELGRKNYLLLHWFNHQPLLGPIGHIPPAEAEAKHYLQLAQHTPIAA